MPDVPDNDGAGDAPGTHYPALMPGKVFAGHFRLRRAIGSGDEGGVWKARDERANRTVTLKLLPDRICREADALADLKEVVGRCSALVHPNIARTYEYVQEGTVAAVVLEYIDGLSLTQLRLEQPHEVFGPEKLQAWTRSLCEALDDAHRQTKLAHGGLRPDNLLVDNSRTLRITGFGVAGRIRVWLNRLSAIDQSGRPAVEGTARGSAREPTVSDDVYGVGSVLYELLTGVPPRGRANEAEPGEVNVPPPIGAQRATRGISGEAVPVWWEEAVAACLAPDPARRPATLAELTARLDGPVLGSSALRGHPAH